MIIRDEDVFDYHQFPRPGKLEVTTSKPCRTQRDLSMAYTPGVARPCLAIEKDPDLAYRYTGKGNLVAVISNGTAVLGLGDIGALAGKPVMEGKAVLFKRFADIDVFDIELALRDPDQIVETIAAIAPTFGGINLEDIKAPDCFAIEEALRARLDIPVFHDDQHGTAIISGAALINAAELVGKRLQDLRVVILGAGAAGIACADMYVRLGVRREHLTLVDTAGVIYKGRTEKMNPYKARFAVDTPLRTLEQAMRGADVFAGVSAANTVTPAMLQSMASDPIVFAMANPDPEIPYEVAIAARPDLIMATGRSDYPNQVNNVLGFPFIFRGALDVRARQITTDMKLAAAHALAQLAREDVPESVLRAYGVDRLRFGRDYLIPKPFDPRVLLSVAPAVAWAAMESGVARRPIAHLEAYRESLERIMGPSRHVMHQVEHKVQKRPLRRIVFPDGENDTVLRAAREIVEQKLAAPVLLGREAVMRAKAAELGFELPDVERIDPAASAKASAYATALFALRMRKGLTPRRALDLVIDPIYFALMMVHEGDADAFIGGMERSYPETIRPAIQIVGLRDGVLRISALHLLVLRDGLYFFADTMVNIDPSAGELAEIASLAADAARAFDVQPRLAFLAFSSFGSVPHEKSARVARAVELLHLRRPDIVADGEMHVDTALDAEVASRNYPHSQIRGDANVLIFPDLTSGNIGFKLVQRLGGAEAIGPILMGMRQPVNVLAHDATMAQIVNLASITALAVDKTTKALAVREEPVGAAR